MDNKEDVYQYLRAGDLENLKIIIAKVMYFLKLCLHCSVEKVLHKPKLIYIFDVCHVN